MPRTAAEKLAARAVAQAGVRLGLPTQRNVDVARCQPKRGHRNGHRNLRKGDGDRRTSADAAMPLTC